MFDTALEAPNLAAPNSLTPPGAPVSPAGRCRVVVIWIDWYAYHVARFAGLAENPELTGAVVGIELVGGIGVHAGLRFREDLPEGLRVETLFPEGNWKETGQLRIASALWQRLDALDPEVVLVPGYYTLPGIAAALWARLHGRKSVLMTESTREDHHRSTLREGAKSLLVRALFNWAVAGGSRHRSYLAALGFPAGRVAGFYDVVDNEGLARRADELRRTGRPPVTSSSPYFLYVGRLAPEKNLSGLLDAYFEYRAQGGRWALVLVGDGPERGTLRGRAESSGWAAEVHFAGHKGSADLPRYYASAGCFVLPSTREPWGLVVNEAMACGLPVIVSARCGCADDLVAGGSNGFVFDPASSDELVRSLAAIEALNDQQWLQMSERSVERIRGYSPAHFGEQIALIANAEH